MDRRNLIKFWLRFTKNLIVENKVKMSLICLSAIILTVALSMDKVTVFRSVNAHYQDGSKHYYDVEGVYEALEYDSEQTMFTDKTGEVPGVLLKTENIHEGAVLLYAVAIILFAMPVVGSLTPDDDLNLCIKKVLNETLKEDLKKTRSEDGHTYMHVSYSKILSTSQWGTSFNEYEMSIGEFFSKESYYTKSEIRDIKLDKLGI